MAKKSKKQIKAVDKKAARQAARDQRREERLQARTERRTNSLNKKLIRLGKQYDKLGVEMPALADLQDERKDKKRKKAA
jgi:hypothetical protein